MKMETCYILAVSASSEESSVSLLKDGKLVFSTMEKEYGVVEQHNDFPRNSFRDCLLKNDIDFADIDFIIFLGELGSTTKLITSISTGDIFLLSYKNTREKQIIQEKFSSAFSLSPLTEVPPLFKVKQSCSYKDSLAQASLNNITASANAAYFFWCNYPGINEFIKSRNVQEPKRNVPELAVV
jgi:predicted NodU family carbamoyl transferase